ncbi:MAG: DNA recombination protein RmuC [Bacteroidales bacterium]|jgi:DNA recombination protein RmuC|nr:DNA recombination protein RmuC [Bacteroidales bacterium]
MEIILSWIIGLIVGGLLVYLILKLTLHKNFAPKTELNAAEDKISALQLDNAKLLSKEEVEVKFVSKELYEKNLCDLKTLNEKIEKSYIAKDSFDIISDDLKTAKSKLESKEDTIKDLDKQLTELKGKEKNLNEKLSTFKDELESLHKQSQEQFKNIATEVLEDKKKLFVDENKKELNTILDPFKTNLDDFKKKVEDTRKEDIQDMTSLKKEIDTLQKLNNQLSDDAKNLATALKSEVKMQGNWGEDRLNMILQNEGLEGYIDYNREEQYRDDEQERNRKPDFVLKLPNDKCIIIDSKVSLTAYVNYFNASTAEEKAEYLKQHLKSVTDHINNLADKNYQSLAGLTTPDYVFLFMPIESALTLALNQKPEIFENALKRKIVLITPTTLVATLKVVKILWQKENQVKNVEEIFRQCGELYNKFVLFLENMDKVETALSSATKAHKEAMDDLKNGASKGRTIIGRFETIKKLEAKTNKSIPAKHLNEIELLPDDIVISQSRTIERKLRTVQELSAEQTAALLGDVMDMVADDDES